MRPRNLILAVSLLFEGAAYGPGELQVRAEGPRLFVHGSRVALAEVLDRLASATGMTVVYEGPRPRQLVTIHIEGRSEVETVQALLEGQAINYALKLDPSGLHVEFLILITDIARGGPPSGSRPAAPPANPFEPPPEEVPADTETAPTSDQFEGSDRELPPAFSPHRVPMPLDPGGMVTPPGMPSFPNTPSNPAGTIQ